MWTKDALCKRDGHVNTKYEKYDQLEKKREQGVGGAMGIAVVLNCNGFFLFFFASFFLYVIHSCARGACGRHRCRLVWLGAARGVVAIKKSI